jgi:hypothetical protein
MSRLGRAALSDILRQLYSNPAPAAVACCAFRRLQTDCCAHSVRSQTHIKNNLFSSGQVIIDLGAH